MTITATKRARLADVALPDFGMAAERAAAARRPSYADTTDRAPVRARMEARRYDRARRVGRPGAQRQPRVPDRVRSAIRGGVCSSSPSNGDPALLVGNECFGTGRGPLAVPLAPHSSSRISACRTGQPRCVPTPLARDPRRPRAIAHRSHGSASSGGRPTPCRAGRRSAGATSIDVRCAAAAGPGGSRRERHRSSSSTPPTDSV